MDLREALEWAESVEDIERGDVAYDEEYRTVVEAARSYAILRSAPTDAAVCLRCPAWEVQWREFPSCSDCGRPWQLVPARLVFEKEQK